MNRELRIIYMGTPRFAVEPLHALLKAGFNVVAVITAPDKPAGRGQKLHLSPVKEFALQENITVLQPVSLKDNDFVNQLRSFNANLQVVVAFRMLPEIVWQMPEYGTINLHASLLPQYRGAAPINHAIINGETETGLTTFFIEKEIDTGNIILSEKVQILPSDDAGSLHDRLMTLGGKVLVETLKMIGNDTVKFLRQDVLLSAHPGIKTAPKIFREDCRIDWSLKTDQVYNKIRGLSPYPAAFTYLISPSGESFHVKIYRTTKSLTNNPDQSSNLITDGKSDLAVTTADGMLHIQEIQQAGKRIMKIDEFLRGFRVNSDWKVG